MANCDILVVGAGIVGSWAALHGIMNKQKVCADFQVIILDQFPLPHTRGSSHGQSRAFKITGAPDMNLILDSRDLWWWLEKESSQQLLIPTGRLTFSYDTGTFLDNFSKDMKKHNIAHEVLEPKQLSQRFPTIYYPNHRAIYEPGSGVLKAHKCVQAVQEIFKRLGGRIEDGCKMDRFEVQPDNKVTVHCNNNTRTFECTRLIIAAGAWSPELVPEFKSLVTVETTAHLYWKSRKQGAYSAANGFVVISQMPEEQIYGQPALEYPDLIKICHATGTRSNPDQRDNVDIDKMRYVQEHYPHVDSRQPAIIERCLFCHARDYEAILARHPKHPESIVVNCGFSAEGFMTSPAVGKILAYMALGMDRELKSTYKMDRYAVERLMNKAAL